MFECVTTKFYEFVKYSECITYMTGLFYFSWNKIFCHTLNVGDSAALVIAWYSNPEESGFLMGFEGLPWSLCHILCQERS